jgi:hypothetical protein
MPFNLYKLFSTMQVSICAILLVFCGFFMLAIGLDANNAIITWCGGVSMSIGILLSLIIVCYHAVEYKNKIYDQPHVYDQHMHAVDPIIVVVMNHAPRIEVVITPNVCIFCMMFIDLKNNNNVIYNARYRYSSYIYEKFKYNVECFLYCRRI